MRCTIASPLLVWGHLCVHRRCLLFIQLSLLGLCEDEKCHVCHVLVAVLVGHLANAVLQLVHDLVHGVAGAKVADLPPKLVQVVSHSAVLGDALGRETR